MNRLIVALRDRAAQAPDAIALDPVVEPPLSYGALWQRVSVRAPQLAATHSPAFPVVLDGDHGIETAIAELALLAAGIPVLSLPRFFTADQARHARTTSAARELTDDPATAPAARSPLPPATARVTFTSGSTGDPRGICLSAGHLSGVAAAVVGAVGAEHAGRHLAVLPPGILLETVAGFFATLLAGGCHVCPPQARIGMAEPFRPDFATLLTAIAELRITSLILVPEYLAGLVAAMAASGTRLPELTIVAVGGAAVSPVLLAQARALGLPVRQGYGLTEAGSVVALAAPDDPPDSVGRPLGHLGVSLARDGEIVLTGAVALGALGGEPPSSPFATGDIGRFDDQGRLFIKGRKSNLIVTSFGRNIAPEWIESLLREQPGVLQAMVWGDGLPTPRALLVPASAGADLAAAVTAVNAALPAYATITQWREVAAFTPDNGRLTGNGRLRRAPIRMAWCEREPRFIDELDAATFRDRLAFLAIPQVRAGLAGTISRATYLAYLAEAWQHVRHTVPLMQAARARLGHRPALVAALDDYIAEEAGHDEWILADIAAAGGDAEGARRRAPAPATRAMVAHAYDTIENGNPASFFGMVYVLESVSVALAERGASAVAERLALPPEAFTYLSSHGALDREHMQVFAGLVNDLDEPDDRAAIVAMARTMFALFGGMFAAIPLEEVHVAAA